MVQNSFPTITTGEAWDSGPGQASTLMNQITTAINRNDTLGTLTAARTGVVSGCTVAQHTAVALAYRTSTAVTGTSVTSQPIVIPATAQTGDLLLLAVMSSTSFTHNTPSGWTLIRSDTTANGSFPCRQSVYERVAIGGDAGTTVTVSVAGGSANVVITLAAYPGALSTINAQAATGAGNVNTNAVAPSVTTTVNGCQILEFYATIGNTAPTSLTNPATSRITTVIGSGFFAQSLADQAQVTAGATSTQTATMGQIGGYVAQTLALAPQPNVTNMSVDVALGVATFTGAPLAHAVENGVVVTAADSTNPRYDLVSLNSSGIAVVTAGTPAAVPLWPAIPAGNAPLALITVAAGVTAINNADIADVRTILGPVGAGQSPRTVNTVATAGSAQTIPDLALAQLSYLTLTAACTLTFPTASAGAVFRVALKQGGVGSFTVTWPGTVKWTAATAPTLTTTVGKTDLFEFTCVDGTNWIGATLALNT